MLKVNDLSLAKLLKIRPESIRGGEADAEAREEVPGSVAGHGTVMVTVTAGRWEGTRLCFSASTEPLPSCLKVQTLIQSLGRVGPEVQLF